MTKSSLYLVGCLLLATRLGADETWRFERTDEVGGKKTTVLGAPRVSDEPGGKAVVFDGVKDALVVPINPLAGCEQFTIEVLLKPATDGPEAQRFIHLQDDAEWRVMIETRVDGKGGWWLDTYLGRGSVGLPLIDPKRVHPTDQWTWVALRYDGKVMTSFINGVKELEGAVKFGPMGTGQISIGARLNKVYWFKGAARELRFHAEALPDEKLARVK
jgi:Concanavalin A-like lectin/glucanases superfamily